MKRCTKIFEAGCLPLTHGEIITSPGNRAIVGLGSGSLKAGYSQNGRDLGLVPYSGYTGNVSRLPTTLTSALSQADRFPISTSLAGAGKSVIWYVILPVFRLEK